MSGCKKYLLLIETVNCSWFGPSHVDGGGDGTTAVFTKGMRSAGPCLSFVSWWLGANGTSGINAMASEIIEAICCVSVRQIQFFTLFCVLCSNVLHLDCIRIWLAISHLRRTVNKSCHHRILPDGYCPHSRLFPSLLCQQNWFLKILCYACT
jgi:hypothetical protein